MRTPARIVAICDSSNLLELFEMVIPDSLPGATLASFSTSPEAWKELSHSNPTLLITTDRMLHMTGEEICRRLLAEGVEYPIIVASAWDKTEEWVKEVAGKGLKVFWLPLPFLIPDFQKVLKNALAASDTSRDKPGSGNPKFKLIDHLMKSRWKMFVAGAVCGLLVGFWIPRPPRYQIWSHGNSSLSEGRPTRPLRYPVSDFSMVRWDTWTGKTWRYDGGTWQPVSEPR